MAKILRCGCQNSGQDALHGDGMRAHNDTMGKAGMEYRCTSCGTQRGAGGSVSYSQSSAKKIKMGGKKAGKKCKKQK